MVTYSSLNNEPGAGEHYYGTSPGSSSKPTSPHSVAVNICRRGETHSAMQSDMSNAFYLFKIPPTWAPYLSFNVRRTKHATEEGTVDEEMVLACRVLSMGWASSWLV